MSDKETALELIKGLPDVVTLEGVIAALQANQALAGAADETGDWSDEELTEAEWLQFVAHSLRDELNDPREDIYSLENGQPEDAPR
jgi:hypothetical protein